LASERPTDIELRGWLAVALREAGMYEDSVAHLKKCLEGEPENGWIWGNLGRVYRKMKRYEESELCLRRCSELERKSFRAHAHLGVTLQQMKNYEEALKQFQIAIGINWEYSWPHIGLAEIYCDDLNQPDKAIAEYEIALRLEQRPFRVSRPLFGLARALEAAGRLGKARQRYQEYLDRFPWGEHAKEAQEALERLT